MSLHASTTQCVAIVGAGPAGIEMAVSLKRSGISYIHFEAGQIGATIADWPEDTRFFSRPEQVALSGLPILQVSGERLRREEYLSYLRQVVQHFGLAIRTFESVDNIARQSDGTFRVTPSTITGRVNTCVVKCVVMANGCMHRRRTLGIPGEELPHVHTRPIPFHGYSQKNVLVVGGRHSALENAVRCARAGSKRVFISYRRSDLERGALRPQLLEDIDFLVREDQLEMFFETLPAEITSEYVALRRVQGGTNRLIIRDVDFVMVALGFEADHSLLRKAGGVVDATREAPEVDAGTFETSEKNIFVIGTATAGSQGSGYSVFIEHCFEHVAFVTAALKREVGGQK